MGKIAVSTIYGGIYEKDKLFDNKSCKLSENLLVPNIKLREKWLESGHICHTWDMFTDDLIDCSILLDLPADSAITVNSPRKIVGYFLRKKWKKDYLFRSIKNKEIKERYLIINEPPAVNNISYNKKYHKYFTKVFTWNDDLADEKKIYKIF